MPHLNIQASAVQRNRDGKEEQLPPPLALERRGPRIQVTVGLSEHIANQLLQQGKSLPNPVSGLALIDSGASRTCIDETSALSLKLPVINVVNVASASHAFTKRNVYPARLEAIGFSMIFNVQAIGAPLASQGLIALIGRDILKFCTLFYNGVTGQLTLSI